MSAGLGVAQRSHKRGPVRVNLDWQELAECADYDPEAWFDPEREGLALSVCGRCPVQQPCRQLGRGMGVGVWGGVAHRPRRKASA